MTGAGSVHDLIAGVASPVKLRLDQVRLGAWLTINRAAACAGRHQPGGEVLLAVGTADEVVAALALARGVAAGGPFVVEYSPCGDAVRVLRLVEVTAQAREQLAGGGAHDCGSYVVEVGDLATCEREATRLRRVRAGHRSQRRCEP